MLSLLSVWSGWRIDDMRGEVLDVLGGIYGERSGRQSSGKSRLQLGDILRDVHGMVVSTRVYLELCSSRTK